MRAQVVVAATVPPEVQAANGELSGRSIQMKHGMRESTTRPRGTTRSRNSAAYKIPATDPTAAAGMALKSALLGSKKAEGAVGPGNGCWMNDMMRRCTVDRDRTLSATARSRVI